MLLVVLFAMLLPGLALAQGPDTSHPYDVEDGRVLVIAHRGGAAVRPENTMLAFRHAVALGVDVLELDVRSTADGVLVVIHDETVDRTTNGTDSVLSTTFDELQQLDAAYHWTDGTLATSGELRYPYRGKGVTVPALEDVLAAFPDMVLSVDIKQREPSIVQPLCEMLQRHAMIDRVVISTGYARVMREFRAVCPDAYTAGIVVELHEFALALVGNLLLSEALPAPVLQIPRTYFGTLVVRPATVRLIHSAGVGVYVWTINSPFMMRRLIAMGVDGIITDRPDILLEILGRLEPVE